MSYENNNGVREGRISLFDSHTNSVEQIANFTSYLLKGDPIWSWEITIIKDKVDYLTWHCQFCKF